jgi:hypothetical protein
LQGGVGIVHAGQRNAESTKNATKGALADASFRVFGSPVRPCSPKAPAPLSWNWLLT